MKSHTLGILEPSSFQHCVIITEALKLKMRPMKTFLSLSTSSVLCYSQQGGAAHRHSGERTNLGVCWTFQSPCFLFHAVELRINAPQEYCEC